MAFRPSALPAVWVLTKLHGNACFACIKVGQGHLAVPNHGLANYACGVQMLEAARPKIEVTSSETAHNSQPHDASS